MTMYTQSVKVHSANSADLGDIIRILDNTPWRNFKLSSILAQLKVPLRLGQFGVLKDFNGLPLGYATWAFVTPSVIVEIQMDPKKLLHESEWNEGTEFIVIDFAVPRGNPRDLIKQFLYHLPVATKSVNFMRSGRLRSYSKEKLDRLLRQR
jgi:hemolysin-activating ACP:hemolysin acyltransferase